MACLGIDQSMRSTGVCVVDDNGNLLDHRTIGIDEKKKEKDAWIEREFLQHRNETFKKVDICDSMADEIYLYIENLHTECIEIEKINIEGIPYGTRGDATRTLGALQFMILNRLRDSFTMHPYQDENNGITITTPTTVKKFATGSGSSKKDVLYECLPDEVKDLFFKYPKTKGRFDLTDAYWLARYGNET